MRNDQLVLASTSAYRRELLARIVDGFQVDDPGVDESVVEAQVPAEIAMELSLRKALAVFSRAADCIVIGSDQVVNLDGEIVGKPVTEARAVEQLERMSGRTWELLTAVSIVSPHQPPVQFLDTTTFTMRGLNRDELIRYVQRDQPLACAGSFRIEAAGIGLFEQIRTEDFTAIIGLPLIRLTTELRRLGVAIP